MTTDIFKDFTKSNIILWTKELFKFILRPRKFIDAYSQKPLNQIFSQYFFYFIGYTFSYLLLASTVEFKSLIKPSVLNLFVCIPLIVFFSVSAKIATGKSYLKKISLFIVTLNLIVLSIDILLIALFITNEKYLYVLLDSLITGAALIYEVYAFSYIIEKRFWRASKIWAVSIVLSTLMYISITYQLDKLNFPGIAYGGNNDYIYTEYKDMVSEVNHRSEIPISESLLRSGKRLLTVYGIDDFRKSGFITDSIVIEKYHTDVRNNIKAISKKIEKLKFQGDKDVAYTYVDYYRLIDSTLKMNNYKSSNNTRDAFIINKILKDKKYKDDITVDSNLVTYREFIRTFNNSIYTFHKWNSSIIEIEDLLIFAFERLTENLIYQNERTLPYVDYIKIK